MAQQYSFPSRGAGHDSSRRTGFAVFCTVLGALIVLLVGYAPAPWHRVSAAPLPPSSRLDRSVEVPPRSTAREDATGPTTGGPAQRDADRATGAGAANATIRDLVAQGEPVHCGAGTKPLVALTFDDGPGPYTQATLDLLRANGMTATFFTVGKLYEDPRFRGLLREEARVGAVGDHTWDHVAVAGLSAEGLASEIGDTRTEAARLSGGPVFLFRPPLGRHDPAVDAYVQSHDMLDVLWDLDSGDSQGANAEQIYETVAAELAPGDIVLFHENRGTTQLALPRILELIREQGYRTVTVPQLLRLDPPSRAQLDAHTCR